MKIIDLLNKIANSEDTPEYITYYNMLKDKTDVMLACKSNIFYKLDQQEIQLNSRIEKYTVNNNNNNKIEKLKNKKFTKNQKQIANKLNEIIDKLNDME